MSRRFVDIATFSRRRFLLEFESNLSQVNKPDPGLNKQQLIIKIWEEYLSGKICGCGNGVEIVQRRLFMFLRSRDS